MVLRLCVAVLMGTLTQALWANEVSDFEASLASYQARMPAACQIKSPAMKVAYACSKIQSPNANPRFHSTIDAGTPGSPSTSSNGVNFCYNSIIEVKRDGGRVLINVTRDEGVTAKGQSFITNLSSLRESGGEIVLPLESSKGLCFGYTESVNANCRSLFSSVDVPLTLVAQVNDRSALTYSLTANRDLISQSRRNSSQISRASNSNEVAEGKRLAILYARAQLVAHAKKKMSPNAPTEYPYPASPSTPRVLPYPQVADTSPTNDEAFSQCDRMLINLENSMNPALDGDPRDISLLATYRQRIKASSPGGVGRPPTGKGSETPSTGR